MQFGEGFFNCLAYPFTRVILHFNEFGYQFFFPYVAYSLNSHFSHVFIFIGEQFRKIK